MLSFQPPLPEGYMYTPYGRRVRVPQNAFEQFQYDFYFGGAEKSLKGEMSGWEKALADFTTDNFSGGLRDWASYHTVLRARGLRTMSPETAAAAVSNRTPSPQDALLPPPVLLDVREAPVHALARPAGSVNVPLYNTLDKPANGAAVSAAGSWGWQFRERKRCSGVPAELLAGLTRCVQPTNGIAS
jgi:hypothetical protein